ncbi:MAG: cupin domain-containing protein [Acidobacteriota bacterium]|nr:cupin domain-containing protein [Acidobacteriota bacterium]
MAVEGRAAYAGVLGDGAHRGPHRPERPTAGPGDLVFKPRGQWHTFWNAGDEPCRILEIISPAGFERFFAELSGLGGVAGAPPEALGELAARYQLEMKPESVPGLVERFELKFPGEPIR